MPTFDLVNARSVPEGTSAMEETVEVVLREREGEKLIHRTTRINSNIWMAVRHAINDITGVMPPDQPHSHDSVYGFAFSAMVDVNGVRNRQTDYRSPVPAAPIGTAEVLASAMAK
ncbi:MAG: hypothetical protein PHV42_01380 [Candidatus Pacebacteria bacterium]|nr:hypothetical protein [Candidatus Paceibacterota bacterium]